MTTPASARASSRKIVHAGTNKASYRQASHKLAELADLDVKSKLIERLVRIKQTRWIF